jgi:general secretion pathway protein M
MIKDWFFGLEPRERLLVGGGGVLLALLLLYLLIWEPIAGKYTALQESVEAQQQSLSWMQQAAAQINVLKRSNTRSASGLGGRSLLAVVDQSVRAGGLGGAIKRIEPDGSKGVKVWLEGAAFDPMILWLGKLSKSYAIEPSIVTVEPIGGGRVNARLTLLEPAA